MPNRVRLRSLLTLVASFIIVAAAGRAQPAPALPPPAGQPQVSDAVGYQHDVEVPVTILDAGHPITAGLKDFTIRDEIYWGFRVGADVRPLLGTAHPKAGTPLMWTRSEGTSRVVFLQLGHDHLAYGNPNFRTLVSRSIHWAARQ